jgi:putative restriction endonuclease
MNNWSKPELIVAFALYCQTPFSKINSKNQLIISLANKINRTPGAVAWKLANFASLDPSLQARGIKGAANGSKLDKAIFEEFNSNWEGLTVQAAVYDDLFMNKNDDINNFKSFENIEFSIVKEKLTTVKRRINQNFFRQSIMASYGSMCCITGINTSSLLVASHIVPWAIDPHNRLNPSNGLCLNALHDKAFDRGLIAIDKDFKVLISNSIKLGKSNFFRDQFLINIEGKSITMPDKFLPNTEFLKYHQENIFTP